MVKPGAAVLDVGLTRDDEGIKGDVDPAVAAVAGHLTPMPGGTGPDDDRDAPAQHRRGRAFSPRRPCISRRLTLRFPRYSSQRRVA